jgi:hypothetical protein
MFTIDNRTRQRLSCDECDDIEPGCVAFDQSGIILFPNGDRVEWKGKAKRYLGTDTAYTERSGRIKLLTNIRGM